MCRTLTQSHLLGHLASKEDYSSYFEEASRMTFDMVIDRVSVRQGLYCACIQPQAFRPDRDRVHRPA